MLLLSAPSGSDQLASLEDRWSGSPHKDPTECSADDEHVGAQRSVRAIGTPADAGQNQEGGR